MSGRNSINRIVERIEDMVIEFEINPQMSSEHARNESEKAIFTLLNRGLGNGLKESLKIIREECGDLLGKPLVDARMYKTPFDRCGNCVCYHEAQGMADCIYGVYPSNIEDCPIDWMVEE